MRPYNIGKLEFPSKPCIFIGYSTSHSAYRCYDPVTGKIYVSRHVKFSEFTFWDFSTPSDTQQQESSDMYAFLDSPSLFVLPQALVNAPSHDQSSPPHTEVRTPESTSTSKNSNPPPPPSRTHVMRTRSQKNILKPKRSFAATKHPLPDDVEPSSVSEALVSPHWRQAITDEFNALQRHGTWTLVSPPSHANIIGCKWVFRIKRKHDGTIERYKA